MNVRSTLGAASIALAIAATMPAAAHDPGDVVTPHFEHAIPNIPGKTLTALIVDYPPGGTSAPHRHADSSFIFAYVLSGEIESKVNDGPTQIYRAGKAGTSRQRLTTLSAGMRARPSLRNCSRSSSLTLMKKH